MPLDFSLSGQAQIWLQQLNLECALCEFPTFEDVCAGQHWIVAIGNDGMGARLAVETEWCRDYADTFATLAHFAYLGKAIRQMRAEEIRASENV